MRVLMLSHTPSDSIFRVGSHHYARELTKSGCDVVRVVLPDSPVRRLRDRTERSVTRTGSKTRSSQDSDGVVNVAFEMPSPLARGGQLVSRLQATKAVGRIQAGTPWPIAEADVVVVDDSRFAWVAARLPGHVPIVYRPTDLETTRYGRRSVIKMAGVADGLVVTSEYMLEELASLFRDRPTLVLPNGVDFERFNAGALTSHRSEGAVYVGALDARFGWAATVAIAAAADDMAVDLYGPSEEPPHNLPANVSVRGPIEYAALPDLLRRSTLGLLPLSEHPSNSSRSPMKLYEYLAAGLNVVASDIPSLRRLELPNVFLYSDPEQAVEMLEKARGCGVNVDGMRVAADRSWTQAAGQLLRFCLRLKGGDQ